MAPLRGCQQKASRRVGGCGTLTACCVRICVKRILVLHNARIGLGCQAKEKGLRACVRSKKYAEARESQDNHPELSGAGTRCLKKRHGSKPAAPRWP